jgi:hypothetical protein
MSTSFQLDDRFFERLDQGGGVFCSEAEGNSCGEILPALRRFDAMPLPTIPRPR